MNKTVHPSKSTNPNRRLASERGERTYSDTEGERVCLNGHPSLRYTSSGACIYCAKNAAVLIAQKKKGFSGLGFSETKAFKRRVERKGIHNLDLGGSHV